MRRKASDKSAASVAVRHVADAFKKEGHKIEKHNDGFTLIQPLFATRVRVEEPEEPVEYLANTIRIETTLPPSDDPAVAEGDRLLAHFNAGALLSAHARRNDGTLAAMTTFPVPHAMDTVDEHLLSMLVAFQVPAFSTIARAAIEGPPKETVLQHGNEPGPWSEADLRAAAEALGVEAEIEQDRMALFFKWENAEGDDLSAIAGFQFTEHPLFGRGLRFTLVPPVNYKAEHLAEVVRQLNVAEFIDDTAAPLLGAWAMPAEDRFSFIGFVPNMLYHAEMTTAVAHWLNHRSRWTRSFLLG